MADVRDDPVTLDWYINYSWFSTPWGENLVSQTITEETGVDIHFITPLGNESEKLNALIASDSLPGFNHARMVGTAGERDDRKRHGLCAQ